MSRGSITWGIGVLAALLTQYKAPKMVPKSSSLGGKPVISTHLSTDVQKGTYGTYAYVPGVGLKMVSD